MAMATSEEVALQSRSRPAANMASPEMKRTAPASFPWLGFIPHLLTAAEPASYIPTAIPNSPPATVMATIAERSTTRRD